MEPMLEEKTVWREIFIKRLIARDNKLKKLAFVESTWKPKSYINLLPEISELIEACYTKWMIVLNFIFLLCGVSLIMGISRLRPLFNLNINCGVHVVNTKSAYESHIQCLYFDYLTISDMEGPLHFPYVQSIGMLKVFYKGLQIKRVETSPKRWICIFSLINSTEITFPSLKNLRQVLVRGPYGLPLVFPSCIAIRLPVIEKIDKIIFENFHSNCMKTLNFSSLKFNNEIQVVNSSFNTIDLPLLVRTKLLKFLNTSLILLKASLLRTLEKIDIDKLASNKPVKLIFPGLVKCDIFLITNSKIIEQLDFPALNSVNCIYLDKLEFTLTDLVLPLLKCVAVLKIINVKGLHSLKLTSIVNQGSMVIINTWGLSNVISTAQNAQHMTFIGNYNLKSLHFENLTTSDFLMFNNMALESLSLPSLNSGDFTVKYCKNLTVIFLPNYLNGNLLVSSTPKMKKDVISSYPKVRESKSSGFKNNGDSKENLLTPPKFYQNTQLLNS
ncbi:uncharacterized protein LOC135146485 [Zophobas morio]|uniref:uncharacterized protein LOC135146485 n=1 Tax=Zophobas morio TaxID=2755281 RepID=UPI003082F31C